MKRTLFLIDNDLMGFFPDERNSLNIYEVFKKSRYWNLLRRIFNKLQINTLPIMYNNSWINKLKSYDKIVIFDGLEINNLVKLILSRFPNKEIIVWYWNPVEYVSVKPWMLDKRISSIWTYSSYDAYKYNLKLNSQFYFKEELSRCHQTNKCNKDVFFVGSNKNRKEKIERLEKHFKEKKISYFFYLTGLNNKGNHSLPMSYTDVLKNINNSKAVLDLRNSNLQSGMSLRPLEALYFKKKLITNDPYIKKEKIYDANNIFILGEDNINDLHHFLNTEFYVSKHYPDLINYYCFQRWSERFTNSGNVVTR